MCGCGKRWNTGKQACVQTICIKKPNQGILRILIRLCKGRTSGASACRRTRPAETGLGTLSFCLRDSFVLRTNLHLRHSKTLPVQRSFSRAASIHSLYPSGVYPTRAPESVAPSAGTHVPFPTNFKCQYKVVNGCCRSMVCIRILLKGGAPCQAAAAARGFVSAAPCGVLLHVHAACFSLLFSVICFGGGRNQPQTCDLLIAWSEATGKFPFYQH